MSYRANKTTSLRIIFSMKQKSATLTSVIWPLTKADSAVKPGVNSSQRIAQSPRGPGEQCVHVTLEGHAGSNPYLQAFLGVFFPFF